MWLKTQQITSDQIETVYLIQIPRGQRPCCVLLDPPAVLLFAFFLSLSLEGLNTFIMHSTGLLSLKSGYKHQNLSVYPDAVH